MPPSSAMRRQSCLVALRRNWTPWGPRYVNDITGGWELRIHEALQTLEEEVAHFDAIPVERTRVEDREPWVRTPLGVIRRAQ